MTRGIGRIRFRHDMDELTIKTEVRKRPMTGKARLEWTTLAKDGAERARSAQKRKSQLPKTPSDTSLETLVDLQLCC